MGFNSIFSNQEINALEKNTVDRLYDGSDYVQGKVSQLTLKDTFTKSAQDQYNSLFVDEVGWFDEFSASAKLAFSDYTSLGIAGTVLAKNAISFMEDMNTKLSSYEWQHSDYYRPGLRYYEGITKIQAKMLADKYDSRTFNKELIQRGGYKSAEIVGAFAGGMADPLLLVGAGFLNKSLQIEKLAEAGFLASKPILASGLVGGLQNLALVTAMEPLVKYNKETFGDVYSWSDFVMSSAGGFGVGFVAGAAHGVWNWFRNSKQTDVQDVLKGMKSIQNQLSYPEETVVVPENLRNVIANNFEQFENGEIGFKDNVGGAAEIGSPEWETQFGGVKETEYGGVENINDDILSNEELFLNESDIIKNDNEMPNTYDLQDHKVESNEEYIQKFLDDESIAEDYKENIRETKKELDKLNELAESEGVFEKLLKCVF